MAKKFDIGYGVAGLALVIVGLVGRFCLRFISRPDGVVDFGLLHIVVGVLGGIFLVVGAVVSVIGIATNSGRITGTVGTVLGGLWVVSFLLFLASLSPPIVSFVQDLTAAAGPQDTREITAEVRLVMGNANELTLLGEETLPITFRASGSASRLDRFDVWLGRRGNRLSYDVSGLPQGDHVISTQRIIDETVGAADPGLVLRAVAPEEVEISVDRLLKRQVPVVLDYVGGEVIESPRIKPPTVEVTAAESVWNRILETEPDPVILSVRKDLSQFDDGVPMTITVALRRVIAGEPVHVALHTVTAALTVARRTDVVTVAVPVRALVPAAWLTDGTCQEYVLLQKEPSNWRAEIVVTGPQKDLETFRVEDVLAYIELTDDDRWPVESWLERRVQVRFPNDLQLQLAGEPLTVLYKLQARAEPEMVDGASTYLTGVEATGLIPAEEPPSRLYLNSEARSAGLPAQTLGPTPRGQDQASVWAVTVDKEFQSHVSWSGAPSQGMSVEEVTAWIVLSTQVVEQNVEHGTNLRIRVERNAKPISTHAVHLPAGLFGESDLVRHGLLVVWQVPTVSIAENDEMSVSFASERNGEVLIYGYGHSFLDFSASPKQKGPVHAVFQEMDFDKLLRSE